MRFYFRTSRRTGISFNPILAILLAIFLWPIFLVIAIWEFVGDKQAASGWERFIIGFAVWVIFVLAVTGQIH